MSAAAEPQRGRIGWLDGVRGGAALFVVLHHMWLATWSSYPENAGPWWIGWLLYGHLAVAVFIVVSGYSLALAPLRHGGRLRGGVRTFIQRRAWRILPAYWAALTFSTAIFLLILAPDTSATTAVKSFVVHTLLLQDLVGNVAPNGTFWSIAVEWQIYFVFPLILLVALRTRMVVAVALTLVAVVAAHLLAGSVSVLSKIDHVSPQFLALFGFGVLAAWSAHHGVPRWVARLLAPGTALVFATFVTLAIVQGSPWMTNHWFGVDLLFGTGVAGALLVTARTQHAWRERTLGSGPAIALGTFSYSLYLMHAPILESLQKLLLRPLELSPGLNFAVLLTLVLPVILAACYAFHRVFEGPFLERRDLASLKTLPLWTWLHRHRGAPVAQVREEPA